MHPANSHYIGISQIDVEFLDTKRSVHHDSLVKPSVPINVFVAGTEAQ